MHSLTAQDAEIARRYSAGCSSSEIARDLNMRMVEVIGRVRALGVQPPGMEARRIMEANPPSARIAPVVVQAEAPPPAASSATEMRRIAPRAAFAARSMSYRPPADATKAVAACIRPAKAPAATGVSTVRQPHPAAPARPAPKIGRPVKSLESDWNYTSWSAQPDIDDEDDDLKQKPGCPRGWLVSEKELARSFHPSKGAFEDAVLVKKRRAAKPVGSLTGQAPRPDVRQMPPHS